MNMEKALRARLVGNEPVAADVAVDGIARVYWVDRPQGRPLPDITFQTISEERAQHLKGFQNTQRARVQVDVRASTYEVARALREKVIAAITPRAVQGDTLFHRAEVAGRGDTTERTASAATVHRHRIDFFITYSPA